jgi:hypothetical protein
MFTLFLLSPADLGGRRAQLILNPGAELPLARSLRDDAGAPVGDVFSFVSSLYFRGKRTYADAFGRPPPGAAPAFVITAADGLRPLDERVTIDRLRRWQDVPIDAKNPLFTDPLCRHAEALERAFGAETRFVLLGSVATNKYVQPLTKVFGDHLWFPPDFRGRGDLSRGALLLRAVREGVELPYLPVEGASLSRREPG